MNWWVHDYAQAGWYTQLVAQIFWVLFSITLHELAHGWAAIRQGDRTPIELGRMNMSPLTHMGTMSLLMFALCGIAWGLMPVNPHRFRNRRWGEVYVSAAGPAMNLLLTLACLVLLTLWIRLVPGDTALARNGAIFLFWGMWLNLFLAVFNLLPIPPLDGATVLSGFSRHVAELYRREGARTFGLFIFIAIFFMTPLGDVLVGACIRGAFGLANGLGAVVANPDVRSVMRF
jgi:Zn-dependent protease